MTSDRARRGKPRARRVTILAVALVGLLSSALVYRLGLGAERSHLEAAFERVASDRIVAVHAGLTTTISSLEPIASFFVSLDDPTPERFRRFVTPMLRAHPEIQAFAWAPVVEHADRDRYEAETARRIPGFQIADRGALGLTPAADRARYFPVEMVEPRRGNEKALGFDPGSSLERRATIEAAIATRTPRASGPLVLAVGTGDQYGFIVSYPAFDSANVLRGVTIGAFRIADVVDRLVRDDPDFTLTIRDLVARPENAQLFPEQPVARVDPNAIVSARTIRIAGRPWRFQAVATQAFLARERYHVAAALLAFWALLFGNLIWLVDRHFAAEDKVRARTAELSQARDDADAATRAKSAFLAAMSHEIRTPLTGVIALTDHLMEQDDLSPRHRDILSIVVGSGEHLQRVINDILDFSKLEAERFKLESRPFDPAEAARGAVALLERKAADKGLTLKLDIAEDFPEQVEGDAGRLRQILLNLISNAIKFTESGGVDVEACVTPEAEGRCALTFRVRDTGAGMSQDALANLFTEFWQADGSIDRRFGGAGLGLAISRGLARGMGGDVSVVSTPGVGSVFTMRAPFTLCARAPAAEASPVATGAVDGRHDFTGRSILIAEDNATNRTIARTILAGVGARVVEVGDGSAALAAAKAEKFDLILMDLRMPSMNGLEAARAIRNLPPPFNETPIVALTASVFQEDIDQRHAAGMTDFLAKPYRGFALRDVAARAMKIGFMALDRAGAPGRAIAEAAAPETDESDRAPPAFDRGHFDRLSADIGADDARALLRAHMADAAARLGFLELARLDDDGLEAVRDQAHAIKGAAAMIGLARFAAIARALEEAAWRKDAPEADHLRREARAAYDAARREVDEIFAKMGAAA